MHQFERLRPDNSGWQPYHFNSVADPPVQAKTRGAFCTYFFSITFLLVLCLFLLSCCTSLVQIRCLNLDDLFNIIPSVDGLDSFGLVCWPTFPCLGLDALSCSLGAFDSNRLPWLSIYWKPVGGFSCVLSCTNLLCVCTYTLDYVWFFLSSIYLITTYIATIRPGREVVTR